MLGIIMIIYSNNQFWIQANYDFWTLKELIKGAFRRPYIALKRFDFNNLNKPSKDFWIHLIEDFYEVSQLFKDKVNNDFKLGFLDELKISMKESIMDTIEIWENERRKIYYNTSPKCQKDLDWNREHKDEIKEMEYKPHKHDLVHIFIGGKYYLQYLCTMLEAIDIKSNLQAELAKWSVWITTTQINKLN